MDPEIVRRIQVEQEKLWKEVEERQRLKKERGEAVDIFAKDYDSPLFYENIDEQTIAKNETLQALQTILHDEENPNDAAENFKNQGNKLVQKFGNKYLRDAYVYYCQGIDLKNKITKPDLLCALYTNRAHVLIALQNYGAAIGDCLDCLAIQPNNIKAMYRIAKSANHISKYQVAVEYCQRGLQIDSQNADLLREMQIAQQKMKQEMDKRDLEEKQKQMEAETLDHLMKLLNKRKIHVGKAEFCSDQFKQFETVHDNDNSPFTARFGVRIEAGTNALSFRVLVVFDEFQHTDVVQEFHEDSTLEEVLSEMMPPYGPSLPFDNAQAYVLDNVTVLYWDQTFTKDTRYRVVKLSESLKDVLCKPDYYLPADFMPVFHVVAKSSPLLRTMKIKQ